jgi:hypothetical protein
LDRVILNYKPSAGRGEPVLPGFRANRQVKIDKRLVKGHFDGVAVPKIPKNLPHLRHR